MAKITRAQFAALQKKLLRDSYIARELGISRQAVYQMRVKFGLKSLVPNHRARNTAIAKAYKSGATGTAIAEKFGISASQAYRVINATLYSSAAPRAAPAKKNAVSKKSAPVKKIATAKKSTPVKKKVVAKKKALAKKKKK